MVGLKSFLRFYINSSLHVSFAILSFTLVTYLKYDIPIDPWLLIFIFFASITAYNFIKYAGIAKFHHFSLSRNLKYIQILSIIAFVGLVWSTFCQSFKVLGLSVLMGSITLLYALPVFNQSKNLRAIPGAKIYVIAMVVTVVTLLIPLIDNHPMVPEELLLDFVQRFCLIIALILPFEIRDLKFDRAQLETIPQRIGVSNSKILGYILLFLVLLLEVLKDITAYSLSLFAIALVTAYVLKISKTEQSPLFSSFWVEAIPILWLGLLLFLKAIY